MSTPADVNAPGRLGLGMLLAAGVGAYVWWLFARMTSSPYESWAPLLVVPLLALVSLPVLYRIAVTGRNRPSFALLCTALALKLGAALSYVAITDRVYDGVADYTFYHETGATLAESYRAGAWDVQVDAVPGYGVIQIVTGVIYRYAGTSLLVAFLVFSWLAFWGLVMVVVAVRTALPAANIKRVAPLVLLLPSTIYWSSALGKDSWVVFAIGLCALGMARLSAHRRGGLALVLLGLLASGMVRPHVALMLFIAVTVAYLGRRSQGRTLGPVSKLVGLGLLAVVGIVLVRYATEFLKIENLSPETVTGALDQASTSSAGGEASIEPPAGGTLTRIPWAVVTVIFRPFLWEAHNGQSAIAALECTFLSVLAWRARDRLRQLPRLLRDEPYVLFVVTYAAMFVFAFSSFANLGTLARERVQLFPLLVVLLCLPEVGPRRRVVPADRPLALPNSPLSRPAGPRLRV